MRPHSTDDEPRRGNTAPGDTGSHSGAGGVESKGGTDSNGGAGGAGAAGSATGGGRFRHLASPEAGWAVPGVTGLDANSNADTPDGITGGSHGEADNHDGVAGANDGLDGSNGSQTDSVAGEAYDWGRMPRQDDPDRFLGFDALDLLDELEGINDRLDGILGTTDGHGARRLAERLTPVVRRLEALTARAIGQTATDQGYASTTHATARAWLADATRVTPATAGGLLADAEFLTRQPDIRTARDAGDLSAQHVAVFRRILTAQPWREAAFADVVDHFVTVAAGVNPTVLHRVLTGWADAKDDELAPDRPDTDYTERALHLRPVGDQWDIRGTLPAVEGASLAAVLDEVIAAARRAGCTCGQQPCTCPEDTTPRATKRADALTALAGWATAHRTCLTADPLLSAGGAQRSRPTILIPLDRLAPHQIPTTLHDYLHTHPPAPHTRHTSCTNCGSGAGGSSVGSSGDDGGDTHGHDTPTGANPAGDTPAGDTTAGTETANGRRFTARELNDGLTGLGVSQVRWYAGSESGTFNRRDTEVELCDATVARIITDPDGYPLDVGHDTRLINPGLRAALIARDGGCVVPGCTTPATWSDAHHVIHWAAGGETSLSNLALCCRRHHRAIHTGDWTITFTPEGHPQANPREITNLNPYPRRKRRQ